MIDSILVSLAVFVALWAPFLSLYAGRLFVEREVEPVPTPDRPCALCGYPIAAGAVNHTCALCDVVDSALNMKEECTL